MVTALSSTPKTWASNLDLPVLQNCNAEQAGAILLELCSSAKLGSMFPQEDTLAGFEVFNHPARLPTLIEVLKKGRGNPHKALPVYDLILKSQSQLSWLHTLPNFVLEALKIEYDHQTIAGSHGPEGFQLLKKERINSEIETLFLDKYIDKETALLSSNSSPEDLEAFEEQETALLEKKYKELEDYWREVGHNPHLYSDQHYEELMRRCRESN